MKIYKDMMVPDVDGTVDMVLLSDYKKLEKQMKKLQKALEFYADAENYLDKSITVEAKATTWSYESTEVREDGGQLALKTLINLNKWEKK